MNVDYATLQARFFNDAHMFFLYSDYIKDVENAFGEDNAYECFVC